MTLIFLVGFVFIFLATGTVAILTHSAIYRTKATGSESGEQEKYLDAQRSRIGEEDKLAKVMADIELKKQQIKEAEDLYRDMEQQLARVYLGRDTYKLIEEINAGRVKSQRDKRSDIEAFLEKGDPAKPDTSTYVKEGLTQERNKQDATFAEERTRLQGQINDLRDQISREQDSATKRKEEFRSQRSKLETDLNQARDELRKFTARERQTADIIPNGMVLKTDYETKIAIIDIGSSNGIKLGFRFEVFQIRAGVYRESKGFLEVKTVNPETATCTLVERNIELPRCPVCGYTARMPEEIYCPYCSGGTSGIGVQKLNASPKKVVLGINPDNPVAASDLIWNPLFGEAKGKIVVYKGDPLLPNRYARAYIEDTIKNYGNRLAEDVSAEVDLLVAGRLATDTVEAARELGIPIVYEFELFPFLRR
jgi:hypothetical protein